MEANFGALWGHFVGWSLEVVCWSRSDRELNWYCLEHIGSGFLWKWRGFLQTRKRRKTNYSKQFQVDNDVQSSLVLLLLS